MNFGIVVFVNFQDDVIRTNFNYSSVNSSDRPYPIIFFSEETIFGAPAAYGAGPLNSSRYITAKMTTRGSI